MSFEGYFPVVVAYAQQRYYHCIGLN